MNFGGPCPSMYEILDTNNARIHETLLERIIGEVHECALEQPNYSEMYAALCSDICIRIHGNEQRSGALQFSGEVCALFCCASLGSLKDHKSPFKESFFVNIWRVGQPQKGVTEQGAKSALLWKRGYLDHTIIPLLKVCLPHPPGGVTSFLEWLTQLGFFHWSTVFGEDMALRNGSFCGSLTRGNLFSWDAHVGLILLCLQAL